jgi:hypothetical protein
MSATITCTGPPGQGVHAPRALNPRGAGDKKHQAGTQNGGTNLSHKRVKWQYPLCSVARCPYGQREHR